MQARNRRDTEQQEQKKREEYEKYEQISKEERAAILEVHIGLLSRKYDVIFTK